jgi:hypothetical protein
MAAPATTEAVAAEVVATAEISAGAVDEVSPAVILPKVVPWNDTVMVEVNPSPPVVPDAPEGGGAPAVPRPDAVKLPQSRPAISRRVPMKASPAQRRIVAAAVLASAVAFAAIGLRASLVRVAPDLAGLYAAIGFPVNLRGLEFSKIKTMREMQDGIPVLVIDGEVMNVTRQPVEVPRLRLAVLGPDSRELYSWTALLSRSVLSEGETLSFRSRLASPPAEGTQVMVRFLTRFDLTAAGR